MRLAMNTLLVMLIFILNTGCAGVTATVGVASVVVGGAIEVVDTITPDIIDYDDDDGN